MTESNFQNMPMTKPCPLCQNTAHLACIGSVWHADRSGVYAHEAIRVTPVVETVQKTGGPEFGHKFNKFLDKALFGKDRPEPEPEHDITVRETAWHPSTNDNTIRPGCYVCESCGYVAMFVNPDDMDRFLYPSRDDQDDENEDES